jgi:hypothetical protein
MITTCTLFHATFEALPLQLDPWSPAILPLLETIAEILCCIKSPPPQCQLELLKERKSHTGHCGYLPESPDA